jgi:hypothetical protein
MRNARMRDCGETGECDISLHYRSSEGEMQVYNAARDAATMTGIPLRQIRKIVQAYTFWTEGESQHHDQGTRANGMARTLTSTQLAARKEWGELAVLLLEDLEDLQGRAAWMGNVWGAGRWRTETAIVKCKERYFSHLAYTEGVVRV